MARAYFIAPKELSQMILDLEEAARDMSVPLEKISREMLKDTEQVFSAGLSSWKPLAPSTIERWGSHPILRLMKSHVPLSRQNRNAWSATNAAVINTAPHAHLMDRGTSRYTTPLFQSKGKRMSKGQVRAQRLAGGTGSTHAPAREFLFVNELSFSKFETIILDYIEGLVD